MIAIIYVIHIIVCLFLILVVLVQRGDGGDLASAFGGSASQTAFGPRTGATLLTKLTTWSAILFMVTSITLSIHASKGGASGSVLSGEKAAPAQQSQPAPAQQTPPTGK